MTTRSGTTRRRALTPLLALSLLAPAALAVVVGAPAAAEPATAVAHPPECPWMDTSLSAEERARLLLDASSLEQKMRWLVEQPAAEPDRTTWRGDVEYPVQVPCTPRLAFANGAFGLDAEGSTAFPAPIAEAATWDPAISQAKGAAVAEETFRAGRNVLLGPGVAGGRTPQSGRTPEYYGEDPVLSGVLAAASIRGLEDGDPSTPVVANLKHYVANEQELDKERSSSNMDERTFRQIYNLGFEIALREGDPGSVMCSYNLLNGAWVCENDVLQTVLKDELGWDGFVMSDFGSVHSTAASLDAGMDMELNRPVWFTPQLLHDALDAGEITEDQIDAAAYRVVRVLIAEGLFDTPLPEPSTDLSSDAHRALARQMAEQGSVLLKNDGTLPLDEGDLTVAVIGPTASSTPTDGISARDVCSATLPFAPGLLNVPCPDPVAPLDSITERVEGYGGSVVFDDGSDPAAAAQLAADADVALVFGHVIMGEDADVADLDLDGNGNELVSAVAAANPRTVAVLGAGTAVVMPWLDDVAAVLHTWYPGEQMGPAISNLLWGDVNPSGKLPMTFPRSLDDIPTATDERYPGVFADGSPTRTDDEAIRQTNYTEGLQIGYRWYEAQGIDPLFAFGHGLSYTTFEYDKLHVTPKIVNGERKMQVHFRVTNTGDRAGDEVAQVYLDLPAEAGEPAKRLLEWQRLSLEPGEREYVHLVLTEEELADRHLLQYWSEDDGDWVTPTGTFTVHVGGSSQDVAGSAAFRVR
jgi:beta-glucosidase